MKLNYLCRGCQKFHAYFTIKFSPDGKSYEKIGQFPPYELEISEDVEEHLGDLAAFYKKGLICESQSYGIGAFAYYRRVVESIIKKLFDEAAQLLEEPDRSKFQEAIVVIEKDKNAADKIKIA
jgi:hypothetical protein